MRPRRGKSLVQDGLRRGGFDVATDCFRAVRPRDRRRTHRDLRAEYPMNVIVKLASSEYVQTRDGIEVEMSVLETHACLENRRRTHRDLRAEHPMNVIVKLASSEYVQTRD